MTSRNSDPIHNRVWSFSARSASLSSGVTTLKRTGSPVIVRPSGSCSPGVPITFSAGTTTSSRNTSLKSVVPVISRRGRVVTPGERMSRMNAVMPADPGTGSVRASR